MRSARQCRQAPLPDVFRRRLDAPASNHSNGSAASWLLLKPRSLKTRTLPSTNFFRRGNLPASAAAAGGKQARHAGEGGRTG